MPRPDSLTKVAQIGAPHGVRGQVKLRSFTDDPEDIFSYGILTDASGQRQFHLSAKGVTGKSLIVAIEGVKDRNAAELLKGKELFASAQFRPKKKSNQWYYGELIGLEARLESGKPYGRVVQVYNFGAGDIIEIELPDGKTEMLPFKDAFVGEVKLEEGYLVVMPPDYVEGKE